MANITRVHKTSQIVQVNRPEIPHLMKHKSTAIKKKKILDESRKHLDGMHF